MFASVQNPSFPLCSERLRSELSFGSDEGESLGFGWVASWVGGRWSVCAEWEGAAKVVRGFEGEDSGEKG